MLIFCADNGIIAENVTQSDNDVTAIVTENFTRGITSVNALSRVCGADVYPVDIGIARDLYCSGLDVRKVAYGTRNFAKEPAMTREEAVQAICTGIQLVKEKKEAGYNLIATGEMGIGNTTTSSAVLSVLTQTPPEQLTGRGAGLSSSGLAHKTEVIQNAIASRKPNRHDILDVLSKVGGLDICGIAGISRRCHLPCSHCHRWLYLGSGSKLRRWSGTAVSRLPLCLPLLRRAGGKASTGCHWHARLSGL